MCGILGFAGAAGQAVDLAPAIAKLRHRGPDDSGAWHGEDAALGFVRLSILDLTPAGHQPMRSDDGRYVIVFNGEIYNFKELREALEKGGEVFRGHSDTEVLLKTFQRLGFESCLSRLRGMFAFAIWDVQSKTLYCARDRLGVKPFVYASTTDGFFFSSEIQGLFALAPQLSRVPDYQAIDHFLTFQYIPSPMSGFSSIKKLQPAHAMVVKEGKISRVFRYWDIEPEKNARLSFQAACETLREQVLEATRLRLISDVPLGAFLSGGVDSSITVAAMARLGASPLKTFSIGFEDERFNELPFAAEVARYLGTEHHEMMVKPDAVSIMPRMIEHLGEPLADNSVVPTYYVSQFARSQLTVALTGDGGDEAFAGYRRFYQMRRMEWLERNKLIGLWTALRRLTVALEDAARRGRPRRQFPSTRADQMLGMNSADRYKHLLAFFTDLDKASIITPTLRAAIGESRTSQYLEGHYRDEIPDPLNRYLYLDLTSYLPEDILFKVDITSMANSLECRSPFLDHKVVEFAASLPGRYKLSPSGRHKHILKEAFKNWLPAGFMDRPKKGFSVPLARWLREDLRVMMKDLLLGQRNLSTWFDQATVEQYVNEHLEGRVSHSTRLWPLLMLSLWIERCRVTV